MGFFHDPGYQIYELLLFDAISKSIGKVKMIYKLIAFKSSYHKKKHETLAGI